MSPAPKASVSRDSWLRIVSCDGADAAYTVASLITGEDPGFRTALVVGSETETFANALVKFHPALKIESKNLWSNDSETTLALGFPDRHFELVIALDSIADLPHDARPSYFRELVRVASREVICAAPLGTDLHLLIDRSLINLCRERFRSVHPDLAKRVDYGLPTPQEAFSWIRHGEDADIFYAGDVAAYQRRAEQLIHQHESGWLRNLAWRLASNISTFADPSLNEPETVPRRRHRRLFLLLRRT